MVFAFCVVCSSLRVSAEPSKHLGLWLVTRKPQPRANAPPRAFHIEYSDAQIPPAAEYLYRDPEYSLDVCVS